MARSVPIVMLTVGFVSKGSVMMERVLPGGKSRVTGSKPVSLFRI
jgi:hypothetical protein